MLNTAIRITDRMGDPTKKRKQRRSKKSSSTLNPDKNTEQNQVNVILKLRIYTRKKIAFEPNGQTTNFSPKKLSPNITSFKQL